MTTQTNEQFENNIEGLGDEDLSWGEYPIDTMLIRQETRTIYEVLRRIDQGSYVMDPDFQRDFIWDETKQSKLIESVMMRIPLPVFYLAEDEQGRMLVVDGLQRLSTFHRFLNGGHQLRLQNRPVLHGKKFHDLTAKLQNRIEDCNLILYIIDAKAPDQARLDIFDRVNSGVPLSRQQARNALYLGDATRFLRDESKTDLFLEATGRSLNTSIMRDREFVNRFCAFQILDLNEYRDMDDFLGRALKKMNAEPETLPTLSHKLKTTLKSNFHLFGKHAFRKHESGQEYRNVLNASLWDVMSTGMSGWPMPLIEERSTALREGFHQLLEDDDFVYSISYSTNSVKQVTCRFKKAKEMFEDVLGAYPN